MTDLVGLPGAKAPTAAAQGRSSCPVCGESEPSPPRCRRCHRRLLPPADSRTALRLTEVSKRYGRGETAVNAVTGLSLEVSRGEMTLLAGPSGSGKTTALLLMGLLLRPDSGTVTLAGTQATALPQAHLPTLRLLSIGFVFQQFNLIASLSAAENVELPLRMAGVRPHFVRRRSLRLLYELELGGRSAHRPAELSGGQKQRVAIARALAVGPDVILADEPTANLDSVSGHTVMAQLAQLAGTNNTGVLIVTHDTRYVDVVQRVLRLEDGRLVTDHTPSGRPSGGFR